MAIFIVIGLQYSEWFASRLNRGDARFVGALSKGLHYVLDKLSFAVGFGLGSQLSAFILQYRQRLGGRLDQALHQIEEFTEVADRYFEGSLEALVEHHAKSRDPTFVAEGELLARAIGEAERLATLVSDLDTALPHQIWLVLVSFDSDLASRVLSDFEPAIVLSPDAIVLALLCGVIVNLAANGSIGAMTRAAKLARPGGQPPAG
jgi:hypothetical protein